LESERAPFITCVTMLEVNVRSRSAVKFGQGWSVRDYVCMSYAMCATHMCAIYIVSVQCVCKGQSDDRDNSQTHNPNHLAS